MAAEPGSMNFRGASGKLYTIDLYLPDAVGGLVGFSPSGAAGATSLTYWRVPENGVIEEISVTTGTTAVGCVFNASGAVLNGAVVRYANVLNTLATRQKLSIPIAAGTLLGATNI